jgi:periplasmic copper chaperone A
MRLVCYGFTAAVISMALSAMPATAHVLLENKEAAVGSRIKAVFIVPHGCSNTDTLKLRVKIPQGVIAVEPEPKEGWTIATTKGKYAADYDYQGGKVSEGVREVDWKGGRVPAKTRDTFAVDLVLTDALKPNTTLYFPVVQECEQGVSRWIEIPPEGSDPHATKWPAPGIKLLPKS